MHGSLASGLPVKKSLRSCEVITMDIIQEIKKRQEKIDANTERIFKLQQQNMKLREEIRKLQRG